MSRSRKDRVLVLSVVAFLVGLALLLSCQPTQPAATPKAAEKAAAGVTAAPAKAAEKPVRGGTLRIVNTSEYASLDPNAMTGMNGFYPPYDQLVEPDPKDGSLTKNGLATDWTVGSDGKSITFKLRSGVKFHDGTDFDAAAVKSNVDRMKDPATKSPFLGYWSAVTSVDVVDPLTVRLNLSQPDVLILPRMAGGAGGLMVSPAAAKKYGQDFPRNPVGTGPFQFVEWKAGDHVTFKRFEVYWKKDKDGNQLPYLDGVVHQFIPDASTAFNALRTGQGDLSGDCCGLLAPQRPLAKADPNLTYQVKADSVNGISLQTKRPPFDNKLVRQAVALAVDREAIAKVQDTLATDTVISPGERKVFDDGKSGHFPARDLAKAKAKMAEAGYPSGGLKVTYTSNQGEDAVNMAQVVKANLAEIGIEVGIEVVGGSAWNTKVRNNHDYQISTGGFGIPVGDPAHYLEQYWWSKGSRNFSEYSNPKFDEALRKGLATYDDKARAALYSEAFKAMVEDGPFIPTHQHTLFKAMSKKVRNYSIAPYWFDQNLWDVWLAK